MSNEEEPRNLESVGKDLVKRAKTMLKYAVYYGSVPLVLVLGIASVRGTFLPHTLLPYGQFFVAPPEQGPGGEQVGAPARL